MLPEAFLAHVSSHDVLGWKEDTSPLQTADWGRSPGSSLQPGPPWPGGPACLLPAGGPSARERQGRAPAPSAFIPPSNLLPPPSTLRAGLGGLRLDGLARGGLLPCRRGSWPQPEPAPLPTPTGSWCLPRPCWAARWRAVELAWRSGQQSAEETESNATLVESHVGPLGEPREHAGATLCVSAFPQRRVPNLGQEQGSDKMCAPLGSVL